MSELTYAQKKYLFAIYKLSQNGGAVKSSDVAKLVGVSKASTAIMTERLSESGFIEKEYYGKIALTESGIKAANPIFTNCVIIRDFLENALGLDKKTADEDAVQISVHASEKSMNRLSEYILGK
ncbi:MAG: metal-dependent transcriptional regulator [Oscillospiraceae bacterium]